MSRINVTKTFLPPREEYDAYLDQIWNSGQITNKGPLHNKFESTIERYLGVKNFHFVTSGTLALQIALKALDIEDGEVITTPFSYVATTSAIMWQSCTPVYVDIDPDTLCMDPKKIEAAITDKTKAIMPVHVFGYPCDVEAIECIAKKHNLKVIYDGAHAFGVEYKGESLLSYGDISMCSFHATKLFHTIEGGCVIAKDTAVSDKVELIKRFGHNKDDHIMLGINAKASEFQAAMGLCNLKYISENIMKRKRATELYDELLADKFTSPRAKQNTNYNYSYYPIIFDTEESLLAAIQALEANDIFPRRYFYPSLNTLPYLNKSQRCPVSEDISRRILCLPLYSSLTSDNIKTICGIIK